ncbi:MAG TPA: glycosyltransferase family 87 protein [Candidatus Limnocylindria bacterium]|nr:glycosyltransferase family 87 protein [Candidatus Limnocylindria bacterium]
MINATDKSAERNWRILTWVLWMAAFGAVAVMVALRPEKRTVTPLYHAAVERWADHLPLYDGPQGMNYLPSFIPVFAPFHWFPLPIAEIAWRGAAYAGLAFGLFWLATKNSRSDYYRTAALITLLALPLSLPALRNGQANAHLGVALLLATVALAAERWFLAACLMGLAIAIKPLGLAAAGLAWMVFPRLWWRLAVVVAVVLGFPFLTAPSTYVLEQFQEAFQNLRQCAEVTENRFADLNGLLRALGTPLSPNASLAMRGGAAILFAILAFGWLRRLPARPRVLAWLMLSAAYLMLFNPMNEANSYVILASPLALWAWDFFQAGRSGLGWGFVAALATMSLLPNLVRPWLGNSFALVWHPLMTLICLGGLVSVWARTPRGVSPSAACP